MHSCRIQKPANFRAHSEWIVVNHCSSFSLVPRKRPQEHLHRQLPWRRTQAMVAPHRLLAQRGGDERGGLLSPSGRRAQNHLGRRASLAQVPGHPRGGALPARSQGQVVVGDSSVRPARLGVAQQSVGSSPVASPGGVSTRSSRWSDQEGVRVRVTEPQAESRRPERPTAVWFRGLGDATRNRNSDFASQRVRG
jgi:hypothetical protein